jgi:hypothetical protein
MKLPPTQTVGLTKYVYTLSTTLSAVPLSDLGPSHPLSRKRMCPPPEPKGKGTYSVADEWVEVPI